MIYINIEQFVIEVKKAMLESNTSQKEIADNLGIQPQGLTKILNKKNFSMEDAKKILDTFGYEIDFTIRKKESTQ